MSFTTVERARLWVSYQRYGVLMAAAALALGVGALWLIPWRWVPLWAPLVIVSGVLLKAAAEILGRFPRKMRATIVAERRIRRGSFRAESVRSYCGDPCFRVVAREVLTRAGVGPREQAGIVARYARELRDESGFVVLVDRTQGRVVRVDGRGNVETVVSP